MSRKKWSFAFSGFLEIYYSSFNIPELEKDPLVYYYKLYSSHSPITTYYAYRPNEHKELNKFGRAVYLNADIAYKINRSTNVFFANKFAHYARYFELRGEKTDQKRNEALKKQDFILYNTYKTFGNPFMGYFIAYFPAIGVSFRF